jgi:hypothetical protein
MHIAHHLPHCHLGDHQVNSSSEPRESEHSLMSPPTRQLPRAVPMKKTRTLNTVEGVISMAQRALALNLRNWTSDAAVLGAPSMAHVSGRSAALEVSEFGSSSPLMLMLSEGITKETRVKKHFHTAAGWSRPGHWRRERCAMRRSGCSARLARSFTILKRASGRPRALELRAIV